MTDQRKDNPKARDPLDEGKDKAKKKSSTSGNREESITESGKHGFESPRSSGTTGLGGETSGGGSVQEPGGVEGAGE